MLVNRVVLVHVELHQGDAAGDCGNQAAFLSRLVHAPERLIGISPRTENVEEQPIGLRIVAQIFVDEIELARHIAQGRRMNVDALGVRDMEQPDKIDGILAKEAGAGRQAALLDIEIVGRCAQFEEPREQTQERGVGLAVLFLERGAEYARQIADVLGDKEIAAHEAFDGAVQILVAVAESYGQFRLHVEGQPFLGTAGQIMQMAAHGPENGLGLLEGLVLLLGEDAVMDEIVDVLDVIEVLADPVEGLQIAQAPLAVLDVWLDQITALAVTPMALVPLAELGVDEILALARVDIAPEFLAQLVEKLVVAPQITGLEKRGAEGAVLLAGTHAFGTL